MLRDRLEIENLQERALVELQIEEEKQLASVELMENSEELKEQIRIKYAKARGNFAGHVIGELYGEVCEG